MLDQTLTLPEDPEELRSFTARLLAGVKAQAILIEKLRHQLAGHRAHRFGASSETAEQLQLALETSEIAAAAMTARMKLPDIEEKDKPKRRPIPDHIPRMDVELTPGAGACADCGGRLRRIGEDVTEELEYVPGRFIVNRIVRPRLTCACCERFVQAPLPSRPIERGRPGPGLLAHVLVSKSEGIVAPVGPRKPRRRRPSSLVSPEPDLRPRRARPRPLHAGRLGRQEHRAAGTARRCHRAACAGRTGDLRGR
jgi:transposase